MVRFPVTNGGGDSALAIFDPSKMHFKAGGDQLEE